MKNIFKTLSASALMLLSLAACQKEEFKGNEAGLTYTFEVSADQVATKANIDGDGNGVAVNRFIMEVYLAKATGELVYLDRQVNAPTGDSPKRTTFELTLIKDQAYKVLFWADKGTDALGDLYYDTQNNLQNVSILDAARTGNNDALDAFSKMEEITPAESRTGFSKSVQLKRPFGQVNFITTDIPAIVALAGGSDFIPTDVKVNYTSCTAFNVLTQEGTAAEAFEYTAPVYSAEDPQTAPAKFTLSMDYMLTATEDSEARPLVKLTAYSNGYELTSVEVPNYPVQRNYRTNIIGNLLTSSNEFVVEVDPMWGNPDSDVELITTGLRKVNGVYEVSAAEGLSYASENIFAQSGGQFVLTEDIDMTGYTSSYVLTRAVSGTYTSANIGAQAGTLVIDGNGHKITKLPGMLIAYIGSLTKLEIKNLTLVNPAVEYDLADTSGDKGVGAFVGYAGTSDEITIDNCHIQGGYVKGGHWTGGFVGYAAGYNTANNGPVFETLSITNCSITDAEVSGKGSVGGIIGHATGDVATLTKIEAPTILRNTITSTGSATDKAGSVVATVGCAGPAAWNGQKGGVYLTSCNVLGNTVKSGNVANTKLWGRQGNSDGELYVDGNQVTDFGVTPPAPSASVNGTNYTSLAAAILETTGDVTVVIEPGDHTLPTNLAGRSITLEGTNAETTVIDMSAGDTPQYGSNSVTFKNVTVKRKSDAYGGLSHCGEEHYVNSKVYGTLVTYAPVFTAVNTEFYQTSSGSYNMHIYNEGSVNLENCMFNCEGKSIYAHQDTAPSEYNISIKDCEFKASQTVSGRAAIQLHTEYGIHGTLDITNCTATGFDSSINGGLWNELNNSTKEVTDNFLKTIDGNIVVRTDAGLTAALAAVEAGETVQILKSGEYALQTLTGENYTLEAVADDVVLKHTPGYGNWVAQCTDIVTVKNLTWDVGVANYQYFQNVNVENCTIKGTLFGHTKVNFKECTFVVDDSEAYNIWTYGANAVFDKCTFNCAGKSVLVYNEGGPLCKVTLNNCVFNASAPVDGKAAIEIDSSLNPFEVYINDCSQTGFANGNVSGNPLWNNKKGDSSNLKVVVDGVQKI